MAETKIEKLGLQGRIEELIASGVTTSLGISNALKADGQNVSQPSVSRYLKAVRDERKEATGDIVRNHIQKTVPADLDALEEMEAQCLTWARESNETFAHRLAAEHIIKAMPQWRNLIRGTEPALYAEAGEALKAQVEAVKTIIDQCLLWIADDIAMQKKRIGAMRMAEQIIETKLRFSGIIDSEQAGNVFIVGKDEELQQDPETGRVKLVFKGGKRHAG